MGTADADAITEPVTRNRSQYLQRYPIAYLLPILMAPTSFDTVVGQLVRIPPVCWLGQYANMRSNTASTWHTPGTLRLRPTLYRGVYTYYPVKRPIGRNSYGSTHQSTAIPTADTPLRRMPSDSVV
jgi:hypothetical protein